MAGFALAAVGEPAFAAVAYIPHGALGSVSVVDTDRDAVIRSLSVNGGLTGVAVAPDGRRLFILSGHSYFQNKRFGNGLTEVDARTGRTVRVVELPGPGGEIAISPRGERVYTAHTGRLIETATVGAAPPRVFLFPSLDPTAIAVSPDGRTLAVSDPESDGVLLIDARSHAATAHIKVCAEPGGLAWSPDGRRLYVVDTRRARLDLVDVGKRALIATTSAGPGPTSVIVTPDGRKLFVSDQGAPHAPGAVTIIDADPLRVRATVPFGEAPSGLAVTPDGRKVYVIATSDPEAPSRGANRAATVSVIDTRSDRVIKTIPVGADAQVSGSFIGPSPPAN